MNLVLRGNARLWLVSLFCLLAFFHANIWGAVIPPWQIPDEAAHYEYVRLLTKLGRPPVPADADPDIQREMLRSMWENHYWEYLGFRRPEQPPTRVLPGGWTAGGEIPDTMVVGDAYVGAFSQLQNPTPLYYALLAPAQRLALNLPVDAQLHFLRLNSRLIFALGVVFIVLAAGQLFGWRAWLVVGAGAFAVLHPMFVYIGSGLNNDNGVIMFSSLAIWQLARAWRWRHQSVRVWGLSLLVATVAIVGAVTAKRTAAFLAPWFLVVLAAVWLSRMGAVQRRRWIRIGALTALAGAALAAVAYALPGPAAAGWTSSHPWRFAWTDAVARSGARAFEVGSGVTLRTGVRKPLGGGEQEAVLRAFVRAPMDAQATLWLRDDAGGVSEIAIPVSDDAWREVATRLRLQADTSRVSVGVTNQGDQPIWLDDLRLRVGEAEVALPNGSAELHAPWLGVVLVELARPFGVGSQMQRLIRDYRANLAALPHRLETMVRVITTTFWGCFGIFARAPNPCVSRPLGLWLSGGVLLMMLIGALGIMRADDTGSVRLMALGALLLLLQTLAPMLIYAAEGNWYPQGRYMFAGMAAILPVTSAWIARVRVGWQPVVVGALAVGMLVLDVVMLQACWAFFAQTGIGAS